MSAAPFPGHLDNPLQNIHPPERAQQRTPRGRPEMLLHGPGQKEAARDARSRHESVATLFRRMPVFPVPPGQVDKTIAKSQKLPDSPDFDSARPWQNRLTES